jgi:hypothetical protein
MLLSTFFHNQTTQANSSGSRESDALGILTEVSFRYDTYSNKKKWIPEVTVATSDYTNGITTHETFINSEALVPVKKGVTLDSCGGWGDRSYLIKTKGQLVGYWDACYTETTKKNGKETKKIVAQLFSFDLTSKEWKLVAKGNNELIMFYSNFRGYAVFPDYFGQINNFEKKVKIYALDSNKLVTTLTDIKWDENFNYVDKFLDENKGNRLLYYSESASDLIESGKITSKESYTSGFVRMALKNDGTIKQIPENIYFDSLPVTIGNLKYDYEIPKENKSLFGYWKNKKFYPLHDKTKTASASFSPNKKYLIVTLIPADRIIGSRTVEYSTLVLNAKTAEIMYDLPIYSDINYFHMYTWLYGDEIARINFWTHLDVPNVNLHLKSGIVTTAENGRQYNNRSYTNVHYSGDYNQLISPEVPASISFNGIQIKYTGQGSFLGEDGYWYVPIRDFADSVGLSLSVSQKKVMLSSDRYTAQLDLKDAIVISGRAYFPYPLLADKLGAEAVTMYDYYKGATINSFTADLTEQELLANNPNIQTNKRSISVYAFDGKNIQIHDLSDEYKSYRTDSYDILVFKDEKLVNINSSSIVTLQNTENPSINMKDIIAINGKGTRKKLTDVLNSLFYLKKNSILVYTAEDDHLRDTILIMNQ